MCRQRSAPSAPAPTGKSFAQAAVAPVPPSPTRQASPASPHCTADAAWWAACGEGCLEPPRASRQAAVVVPRSEARAGHACMYARPTVHPPPFPGPQPTAPASLNTPCATKTRRRPPPACELGAAVRGAPHAKLLRVLAAYARQRVRRAQALGWPSPPPPRPILPAWPALLPPGPAGGASKRLWRAHACGRGSCPGRACCAARHAAPTTRPSQHSQYAQQTPRGGSPPSPPCAAGGGARRAEGGGGAVRRPQQQFSWLRGCHVPKLPARAGLGEMPQQRGKGGT